MTCVTQIHCGCHIVWIFLAIIFNCTIIIAKSSGLFSMRLKRRPKFGINHDMKTKEENVLCFKLMVFKKYINVLWFNYKKIMSIATCLFSFNLDISDMIKLYSSWVKHFLIASNKLQWKHFFHNVSSKHENAITITKVQQEGHINKTNHVLPQVHVRTQDWIPFRKKPTSLRIVVYVHLEQLLLYIYNFLNIFLGEGVSLEK